MKASRKNRRIRPKYQREFIQWFRENKSRFYLPFEIVKRNTISLKIILPGLSPLISFSLAPDSLMVWVHKDKEYFDILADIDVFPMKKCRGFVCRYCFPESQVIYPDLASLQRAEIYECFLTWANTKLANARWIKLYKTPGFWGADLIYRYSDKDLPTPGIRLCSALVGLSGEVIYDPERDEMQTWLYPVFPEAG